MKENIYLIINGQEKDMMMKEMSFMNYMKEKEIW